MLKFEIGKRYAMKSPCNQDCEWRYTVTARTACTVTLKDERGELKTCRINKVVSKWSDTETVYPLGQYSMCPMLNAGKTLN